MKLILLDRADIDMKRPRDRRKTLAQRPGQQSKSITHEAFVDLKHALEDALDTPPYHIDRLKHQKLCVSGVGML
jgi:hypothetical protein